MALVKIVSPAGWDFDGPIASPIKVSNRGLIGFDRRDFVKRAGVASNVFLPFIDQLRPSADEEPVHLISHGASDYWGANRNGDGFKEATCKEYCHTFEKYAKVYRNHKNKDPRQSYGYIKKAAYNDTMRRVELLTFLNKTAAAAERNGGLVADRELEKLARGEDLATSMACRVPHDICSYCNNKARTRDEYCTADTCKAGGCKENLTHLVKLGNDVHHLHVDNPTPVWFDSSSVFRPADRIAYGHKADWLTKAASAGGFFGEGGAKMAEDMGLVAPLGVILDQAAYLDTWDPRLTGQLKLAHGLDGMEARSDMHLHPETRRAFTRDIQPPVDLLALELAGDREKTATALGALADRKIVLSLRDFARMTKRAELSSAAAVRLPGVYGRMIADGSLERRLSEGRYAPSEKLASLRCRQAAERLGPAYSLDREAVERRCVLAAVRQHPAPPVLKCGFEIERSGAEDLARDYACYKAAALCRIAQDDGDFMLTCRMALTQNQVD